MDFSEEMIDAARRRHPELRFVQADAHALNLSEKFDVIILSDLVNDLWDVQTVLQQCCPTHHSTQPDHHQFLQPFMGANFKRGPMAWSG